MKEANQLNDVFDELEDKISEYAKARHIAPHSAEEQEISLALNRVMEARSLAFRSYKTPNPPRSLDEYAKSLFDAEQKYWGDSGSWADQDEPDKGKTRYLARAVLDLAGVKYEESKG